MLEHQEVRTQRVALIEEFRYPSSGMPVLSIWQNIPSVDPDTSLGSTPFRSSQSNVLPVNAEDLPAVEQAKRSFAAGREQGIAEGQQLEKDQHSTQLREIEKRKIQEAAGFAEQVASERDRFLQRLEVEVVKLSLSIAARILRHESQMDPLFLSGAVRVALGQLARTATVRLRIPIADFELWSETIAHSPNLKVKPTVMGDETMQVGDCVLETDMGEADLGFRSQLAEIAGGLLSGVFAGAENDPANANNSVSQ